jgi:hypothetical protein
MRAEAHQFRDALAAAMERAERLARDNAVLRARLAARRFDRFQWLLVSLLGLCAVAIVYILAAGH